MNHIELKLIPSRALPKNEPDKSQILSSALSKLSNIEVKCKQTLRKATHIGVPRFEPFMCLDLVSESWRSLFFQIFILSMFNESSCLSVRVH